MPRFQPFAGLRFDPERVALGDVTAPPYDVIDAARRAELAGRSPHNIVHVDVPSDAECEPGDADRYAHAARLYERWQAEGVLVGDDAPAFYGYRMGYRDAAGVLRQTAGVIGALGLAAPGDGDVLPHERTTPKDRSDRLALQRATKANLSAVWGLSLASGLGALAELPGPPLARWTDDAGVHHRLYRIAETGVQQAIAEAVASAPVVIADGHHRYATALAYQDERSGDGPGPWDAVMTFVVELDAANLHVQPIHRVIDGVDPGTLRDALTGAWTVEPLDVAGAADPGALLAATAPGRAVLATRSGVWTLTADAPASGADPTDGLDTARLERSLAGVDGAVVCFDHDPARVLAAVETGSATAAVLLAPVGVDVIADVAHAGARMPPKTTFFAPKPATGTVLRPLG